MEKQRKVSTEYSVPDENGNGEAGICTHTHSCVWIVCTPQIKSVRELRVL